MANLKIAIVVLFVLNQYQVTAISKNIKPSDNVADIFTNLNNSDTVIFEGGTYSASNLPIEKSITVIGLANTILDGLGKGSVLVVKANSVRIENIKIRNTGISYTDDRAGIKVLNVENCIVKNCIIENCFFGLAFTKSKKCSIENVTVTGSGLNEAQSGNAIHIYNCEDFKVLDNIATKHRDGIYIEFTKGCEISNNKCEYNVRYGLHFMFSNKNSYYKNIFSNNGAGVAVMYSENIIMTDNEFTHNWSSVANGLLLKDIKNSKIERNIISHNTTGIYAEGVMRTAITNNNLNRNGWGLKIMGNCEDNKIERNNFIANTFEVTTNSGSNYNTFANNFWSNYSGYDLNKDGFGDIPHHPVILFTYLTEQVPYAIILIRSLFVDLLNLAEKITPALTPATLRDDKPSMKRIKW